MNRNRADSLLAAAQSRYRPRRDWRILFDALPHTFTFAHLRALPNCHDTDHGQFVATANKWIARGCATRLGRGRYRKVRRERVQPPPTAAAASSDQ